MYMKHALEYIQELAESGQCINCKYNVHDEYFGCYSIEYTKKEDSNCYKLICALEKIQNVLNKGE